MYRLSGLQYCRFSPYVRNDLNTVTNCSISFHFRLGNFTLMLPSSFIKLYKNNIHYYENYNLHNEEFNEKSIRYEWQE